MRKAFLALALAGSLFTQPTVVETVWSFLTTIWSESSSDAGCGADPNGGCFPVPQPESDAGCGADPNGCPEDS